MFGLGSHIIVEKREDGHLLAKWVAIPGISFPVGIFEASHGHAPLVAFHRELGEALGKMSEEQRLRAHVSVQLDDENHPYHVFGFYKVESEEEYAVRVAQEKANNDRYEAESLVRRRELYEKLKEEFEP